VYQAAAHAAHADSAARAMASERVGVSSRQVVSRALGLRVEG